MEPKNGTKNRQNDLVPPTLLLLNRKASSRPNDYFACLLLFPDFKMTLRGTVARITQPEVYPVRGMVGKSLSLAQSNTSQAGLVYSPNI